MSRARTKSGSEHGSATSSTRARRSRPTPKWLTGRTDLDELAKRRCLMILSVLSGERPVSDVLEEQGISRGTYYNMEQRALEAMLAALIPLTPGETSELPSASPAKRIVELEAKVAKLERDKRRHDRLLFLTKSVMQSGSVKSAAGRPTKKKRRSSSSRSSSTKSGPSASMISTKAKKTSVARTISAPSSSPVLEGATPIPSTPSADGVDER